MRFTPSFPFSKTNLANIHSESNPKHQTTLHRIPWSRGSSYESIIETYSKFVACNYGKAVVVFDGYKKFTTKVMTHKCCLKGKKGVSLTFSLDMSLSVTKEAFFSDPKNKKTFH